MITVQVSDKLVKNAERRVNSLNRSVSEQIEYWAKIGKITEDNPDIPYEFLLDILTAKEEIKNGEVSEYIFYRSQTPVW
ncbi:hypothetical protein QUF74_09285 [Candidatus Halobeggiatoa sp. HSG11]|nr:hypothetical protein [Candidatus Halobeggiatoa sp. HSG11]